MQTLTDIEASISTLSLAKQIALRDRLDESIDDIVELTAAHTEQQQMEEMERRLADYLAGKIPSQPADVAFVEIRTELGL